MRDNIFLAQAFVAGFTLETFTVDRRTFYAVTRCLEIVSEASRRLSPALRARHPQLPWRAIMGVGNVYRHDYDNVAEEFVWRTVQQSLARLLEVIEIELAGSQLTLPGPRSRLQAPDQCAVAA
jgi:uncharacterized protein with HEPN domain